MPPDPLEWALAQFRQPGLSALRGPDGGRGLVPLGDTTPPVGGDRRPFFARLLAAGTGGQYSFVEVQQSPSAPGSWVVVPDGATGPAAGAGGAWSPAADTSLPTDASTSAGHGAVVWLEPASGDYAADYAIVGFAGGGSSLEVKEADGAPDYAGITVLVLDQAAGLQLSQPAGGQARVTIQAATTTQAGVVSTAAQTWAGGKTVQGSSGGVSPALSARTGTAGPDGTFSLSVALSGGTLLPAGAAGYPLGVLSASQAGAFPLSAYFDLINARLLLGSFDQSLSKWHTAALATFDFPTQTVKVGITGTDSAGNTYYGGICCGTGTGPVVIDGGSF